ncbi:MAG: copper-translocating P-type ATPase [Ignavibacteria bacterium RIFOXYB2_FULL_35_12]|nr:MAG: copper-translocating P-type ATPase [Ignavibacteria bacterium GWA2_36_19]OGU61323.1 MAG: copper-translocating P-type ATPase [Ignavibacteria bacterium GWF2_35_20]OGU79065.1 MAG: copper-translocating P-type ATPase [Ignavibacteria bacterium RIFOXYA2_FULL_35_9]OGU88466.1 MAG: copper-translocating P-type ATPase [Ignavibacteria bacterium RIFOXYA12_FULL_35_25]OGU92447.1 MAG: copper-translocating P-type ATPase [Ignavibacteria bacterium RIFOXYC12_FULL_35_11]OGU95826.1 MAG: copper-translocating P
MIEKTSNVERIIAPVEGMTCASCVARVEKSILKVEGVKNVSVNLATEKAMIELETGKVNLDKIAETVEAAGYKIDFSSQSKKVSRKENEATDKLLDTNKKLKNDFILALVLSIPILILNMGTMWADFENLFSMTLDDINKILLLLTTPVIFISGKRFFKIFFSNLTHFSADMNTLVAVGTGSAYLYSTAVTLFPNYFLSSNQTPHVYFDTTAVIITLILMGKWLEAKAKTKTGSTIKKLLNLKPEFALIKKNGIEARVSVDEIKTGDIVLIKPGGKIPADGMVLSGTSVVDESMITGESIPVEKSVGEKVIGGTINKNGFLEFEVTATGDNSLLGQIIRMVAEAQGSKAPIQNLADKVASVFVPVVIVISIITFIVWIISGSSFNTALINFVAVLIIACPCALGLATPTAIIVGTGKAAQLGILIKDGESLETAHKISTIIFDKTGTLTEGKPILTQIRTNDITEEKLLQYAASLEKKSEHPFGESIVEAAQKGNLPLFESELLTNTIGRGILGKVNGSEVAAGNIPFMKEQSISIESWVNEAEKKLAKSGTIIFVAIDKKIKGLLKLEDVIRIDSKEAVKKLKNIGLKVVMLTGDNRQNAKHIAEKAGIDFFEAEILPDEKANVVKKFQKENEIVAMVGDGINDSPALAQSDIGIALGTGTDIAIESSSIIIIRNNLNALVSALQLSKKTIKTIKQNLFWAFFYNVICIPLAALGLLNPMFAALAMSLSSVSVVSNSLRIKNFKPEI